MCASSVCSRDDVRVRVYYGILSFLRHFEAEGPLAKTPTAASTAQVPAISKENNGGQNTKIQNPKVVKRKLLIVTLRRWCDLVMFKRYMSTIMGIRNLDPLIWPHFEWCKLQAIASQEESHRDYMICLTLAGINCGCTFIGLPVSTTIFDDFRAPKNADFPYHPGYLVQTFPPQTQKTGFVGRSESMFGLEGLLNHSGSGWNMVDDDHDPMEYEVKKMGVNGLMLESAGGCGKDGS